MKLPLDVWTIDWDLMKEEVAAESSVNVLVALVDRDSKAELRTLEEEDKDPEGTGTDLVDVIAVVNELV